MSSSSSTQTGRARSGETGPNWRGLDGGAVYPAAGSISPHYYAAPVEDLDARRYPFGFDTDGFKPSTQAGWTPAVTRATLTGLTPDPAANLRLAGHQPVKVTALGPGRYLLDFGVTQVGGLRLTLDGTAGAKVRILSGEVLAGPGSVQYELSAGDTYDDTWTLRAGSSAPLNEVWQFTKNTIEALNLSPYVDSPTRERSSVYAGDEYIHQQAQAMTDGDSAPAEFSLDYALTYMALGESTRPPLIEEYEELAPVPAGAVVADGGPRHGDRPVPGA